MTAIYCTVGALLLLHLASAMLNPSVPHLRLTGTGKADQTDPASTNTTPTQVARTRMMNQMRDNLSFKHLYGARWLQTKQSSKPILIQTHFIYNSAFTLFTCLFSPFSGLSVEIFQGSSE